LTEFNTADDVRATLTACLAVPRWVDAVLAGRPYDTRSALLAAADFPLSPGDVRAAMAAHPDDPAWTSLPERLCATSPPFREIWERYDVAGPAQRTKRYRTDVGDMTFESTTLVVADAPELRLMLLRPVDAATADHLGTLHLRTH